MTDEEDKDMTTRRTVLRKSTVFGTVAAGGVGTVGAAAGQAGEQRSASYSPPLELADGNTVSGGTATVDSLSYDVEDMDQESSSLESVTLLVREAEGREGSGRGTFEAAVEATNTEGETETSDYRSVDFDVYGSGGNAASLGTMYGNTFASMGQPCEILFLPLKGLLVRPHGLRIRLRRVVLITDTQQGEGNLLGNLLCALAGLVDPA